MKRQRFTRSRAALAWVAALGMCATWQGATARAERGYHATVRRTTAGVPHVMADDLGGVGYGYGYVFAQDNVCLLLEEVMTVRGERAKHFGPKPYDAGNTASHSNVLSDAVYRMLATQEVADRFRASLDHEGQALVRGYAAGVSRYVRELRRGDHPGRHLQCRHATWLREIDDADVYLRFYKLNLLAGALQFIDGIAAAKPPTPKTAFIAPDHSPSESELRDGLASIAPNWRAAHDGEMGSNMYAFGREVTSGGAIVFGNPHFPWFGGERFYQVHLTVPGVMDVQGTSVSGVPMVNIGFTKSFAWSHTTSYAHRFTPYALTLKPGDPLTYLKDGEEKRIEVVDIGVEVLRDGSLQTESVRLYRSEYGPMVYLGNEALAWTHERAITLRDANAENFRALRQFLRWNQARSLDEFARIQREELGTPWVHTVAADAEGSVYYADMSVVPNVSDALARECAVPGLSELVEAAIPRLPLLDGSRSACAWKVEPGAPQAGAMGAAQLPHLRRDDYALNCNDSHWLTHPRARLEGFPRIVGLERAPQSLRSRLGHQQVLDRLAQCDGLHGRQVTHDAVAQIVLGARIYSAEREKKRWLEHACRSATMTLTNDVLTRTALKEPVEVPTAAACTALRAWDDRNDADSRGSLLWDEFWFRVEALRSAGTEVYTVPFRADAPLDTPRALDLDQPALAEAFAAAIHAVGASGFALDAPRSAFSFRDSNGERIPVPGGYQRTGAFTIAQAFSFSRGQMPNLRPAVGYGPVTWGNSYMQVVSYPDRGAGPRASTFVTYGQSSDPASPHHADYTRRYANKEWVRASFTEADIRADTQASFTLDQD